MGRLLQKRTEHAWVCSMLILNTSNREELNMDGCVQCAGMMVMNTSTAKVQKAKGRGHTQVKADKTKVGIWA
jgi:hypothetical protein